MGAYMEKLGEKGLLAIAIVLSSIWLAAVPVIYLLLREYKKEHGVKKQNLGSARESENDLPTGKSGERSKEKPL